MQEKITVARHQTARRYARILDALTRAARKPDKSAGPGHKQLENIQLTLTKDNLRAVAANGFVLAAVDLPLPGDTTTTMTQTTTALVPAADVLRVARDLKKGGAYDPHLTISVAENRLTLTSERGNVSARPEPNPHFPPWKSIMPEVMEDDDCQRSAVDPKLMALAAHLCTEIEGTMVMTAVSHSGPIRIDCVSKNLRLDHPPRAVIALMPRFIRWDDPEAIRFHSPPEPAADPGHAKDPARAHAYS